MSPEYDSELKEIVSHHLNGYEQLYERLHFPFNIEVVVTAFENIARKLMPQIDKYATIIGDDVSGRLPTLVIADLARRKRKLTGLKPPEIYFVNAGSNVSRFYNAEITLPKIRQAISQHNFPGKVLLVTEYISTGNSISVLARTFSENGINPDIAIIDSQKDPYKIASLSSFRIFCGGITGGVAGGSFFFRPDLACLRSPFQEPFAIRDDSKRPDAIVARKDMKLIADYLWQIVE